MLTLTPKHPPQSAIIGAYSLWPRRRFRLPHRRAFAFAAGLGGVGLFAHCLLPLLVAAA